MNSAKGRTRRGVFLEQEPPLAKHVNRWGDSTRSSTAATAARVRWQSPTGIARHYRQCTAPATPGRRIRPATIDAPRMRVGTVRYSSGTVDGGP
jgi:hypothetical protein